MLTIQQIKEYGKISGNTVTEIFPNSSIGTRSLSRVLEFGFMNMAKESYDYMIGISFKSKTYWWSKACIFELAELEELENGGLLNFDHSYNGNTGQVIKGLNQGYDVEERILNKLDKVAEKSAV